MPISKVECTDAIGFMKDIEDGFFDITITDPPYNLGRKYNGNYDDKREDYEQWCRSWFSELKRITKRTILFSCGVKNIPMWFRIEEPLWMWMWFKGNNMGSGSQYTNIGLYEPYLIYKNCKRLGVDGKYLPIAPQEDAGFHDCPKPLKLITHLINEFCEIGDKIFDPFVGSQTCRIAAYKLGFDFWGTEIDKDYFEQGNERFKKAIAEPLFDNLPKYEPQTLFPDAPTSDLQTRS